MTIIVHFLMILITLVACLKMSHAPKWYNWLYALLLALFILLTSDWTSSQPRSVLTQYVEDQELRNDMALLVTLESSLFILFSFLRLSDDTALCRRRKKTAKWLQKALVFYPSLLLFPILLYVQSQLFIHFPGYDFTTLSALLASAVVVVVVLLPILLRLLIAEPEGRLELLFLSSLFLFAFGLITTVNERMVYQAPEVTFSYSGLIIALLLFLICVGIGYYLPSIKRLLRKCR